MLRHLPEDQSHLDRFPECANGLAPLTYLYRLACPLSSALFRGGSYTPIEAVVNLSACATRTR